MIPYAKHFNDSDLDDMLRWINENLDNLPESLRVDSGTYIPDLRTSVSHYLEIIPMHRENPTYSGQIYLMFRIRERVEAIRRGEE